MLWWTPALTRVLGIVLMLMMVVSTASSFVPAAHASRNIGSSGKPAEVSNAISINEHEHTHAEAKSVAVEQCATGDSHQSSHQPTKSDCCAAMCHDLSVIGTFASVPKGPMPTLLAEKIAILLPVVPSRHLRPPRA
jgi:hypothetical protein